MRAIWLSVLLGFPFHARAQENTDEETNTESNEDESEQPVGQDSQSTDSDEKPEEAPNDPDKIEEKDLYTAPKSSGLDEDEDGVLGPVDESETDENVFNKLTDVNEKFGVIFRPQVGVTTLTTNAQSYAGYHAGLHLGYHKYYKLKLADVGTYTRTRVLILPTVGELNGSDLRLGSFVGIKLTAMEIETGIDLLRHRLAVRETMIDYAPDVGIAIPLRTLLIFDNIKVKAGVEPRTYLGNTRTPINWEEQAFRTPLSGIVDEFSWTLGMRFGLVGLSYDQLHLNNGIQRIISLGLQR